MTTIEWHIGKHIHIGKKCKEHALYADNPLLSAIVSIQNPFDMQQVIGILELPFPTPMLRRQTNMGKFNAYDANNQVIHEELSSDEEGIIHIQQISSPYKHAYKKKINHTFPDDFIGRVEPCDLDNDEFQL